MSNYKKTFYTIFTMIAGIVSASPALAANPPSAPRLPCASMSEGHTELILFTNHAGQNQYEKIICSRVATSAANTATPIDRNGNAINEGGQPNKYDQYIKASGSDIAAGNYTWRYMIESNFSAANSPGLNNLTFDSCVTITTPGANTVNPPAQAKWAKFWIIGAGGGGGGVSGNPYASCSEVCNNGNPGGDSSIVFYTDGTPSHAIKATAKGGGGGTCSSAGTSYSNNGYNGYGLKGGGNGGSCGYVGWCWAGGGLFPAYKVHCTKATTINSNPGGNGEVKYYESFVTGGVPFTVNVGAGGTGGSGTYRGGNGVNGFVRICWYK